MTNQFEAKVVLLGQTHVGKTCLWHRYLRNVFAKDYQSTIAAAYGTRVEEVDGRIVKLNIWDTAGSEQYETLCKFYYRGATVAIICYDLTDAYSYDKAKLWVRELHRLEEDCAIFLCGTKLDLIKEGREERKIDSKHAKHYAEGIDAKVFETSSRTGQNVWELFHDVARTCLEKLTANPPMYDQGLLSLRIEEPKKRKRCLCD